MVALPEGSVPVKNLTTAEILYGSRTTTHRYELLSHDPSTGRDSLNGWLDGVTGGSLTWSAAATVKKSGTLDVEDLAVAAKGFKALRSVSLPAIRIRPVLLIAGLPEIPLGVYLVTAAPEEWAGTGRTFSLELHDKTTALEQDRISETFTAGTSSPVLSIVKSVVESAGEAISVDGSETRTLSSPMVWPAGTSKVRIVNDLLDAIGYNALWVDGRGNFRATPYVRPAARPIGYELLNGLDRELLDGEESIYSPEWTRDRDSYGIPNKVIAVQAAGADAEPLTGEATNTNPDSPYSYSARGRWVTALVEGVETPDGTTGEQEDFLEAKARQSLIAMSSPQATVSVRCLPIPLELLDALRFASTPAGIDARHTVRAMSLDLAFNALMELELQEVVDL